MEYYIFINIFLIIINSLFILFLYYYCNKKEKKTNIKKIRLNSQDFPPPFPNTWYFIEFSSNIKKGQINSYSILDREIVVFRNNNNEIGILNAFCPHLGTHLGYGGYIKNNNIVCPYHSWNFDKDGICKNIPYSKSTITDRCNTTKYYSLEKHNMIFLWYHADNKEPNTYEIGILNELDNYTYITRKQMNTMNMHIFEPSQNSADYYHFQTVHRYLANPIYNKFIEVFHKISTIYEDTGYKQIIVKEEICKLNLFGFIPLPKFFNTLLNTKVIIETPSIVLFKIDNKYFGEFRAIMTITPIEKFKQKMFISSWGNGIFRFLFGKILTYMTINTVYQDQIVWEHKIHINPRNWVSGDGPWASYNKWLEKFYSKSSEKQYNILEW